MPDIKRIGAAATIVTLFVAAIAPSVQAQVPVSRTIAPDTTLSGVVQDTRGLPLLGAFVAVIALGADEPSAVVVTDGRGAFSIGNLPRGVYSLLVGSLGFTGTVLQGINLPTAVPVTLQLEPDQERSLAAFDAPLDLGYALRTSNRDVLRQTDTTLVTDEGAAAVGSSAPASDGSVRPATVVGGEIRLWSFANVGNRETVGVTTLDLSGNNMWSLRAHVGNQGSVWAASNLQRSFGGGHDLRVGFGYVGGGFQFALAEEMDAQAPWIGRLEIEDTWQVAAPLQLHYGVRYEHHNYLGDTEMISPAFELTFAIVDNTHLTTGVSMNTTGLGLAEDNGFEVMSVLNKANIRINDTTQVVPSRAVRYHFGLEQIIGGAAISVRAYYDAVTDELLGVYLAGASGRHDYMFLNVGDTAARGVEVGVAGKIVDSVSGRITYAFRDRQNDYGWRALSAGGTGGATVSLDQLGRQTHEVNATLAARIPAADTFVEATYNWRYGLLVVRDGQTRPDIGRFDFRVRQPLPFHGHRTEWSAILQVRNLLGQAYDGLYNVSLAELVGLTRGIAGGLAVRF